jgi:predicted RNA-binding protein with EMAP domain
VAKHACSLLGKSLQQKSGVRLEAAKEVLAEHASTAESLVMALMYSYLDPGEMAECDSMRGLLSAVESISGGVAPVLHGDRAPRLLRANLGWCIRTLSGLPHRLRRGGTGLASGVDLMAVTVTNVAPKGSLWLTRVSDGVREIPVMTNIPGMRSGTILAVAFLPPREVGGEVSEAMYLGDEPRAENPGTFLTDEQVDAREANSILHEELAEH